ncbi:MAG: tetratricopeptide repeat protein [Candidatus Obscuribacterales bacterium]|nr:tetratricopeptide repeat protein [Candidatus Obscuribacterales bacterium]
MLPVQLTNKMMVSLAITCFLAIQAVPQAFADTNFDQQLNKAESLESQGELKAAERAFNDVYQTAKNFPEDDVRRMKATESLAHAQEMEGRYTSSISLYQEALALRQKAYGDNSPRLGKSYFSMGRVRLEAGDYDNARTDLTKALKFRESSPDSETMPLGYIHYYLGRLDAETGNYEKATEHLTQCQTIAQQNAKHRETVKAMSELAIVALAQHDLTKAENQSYTALNLAEKFAGDDPVVAAQALDTVAKVKLSMGDTKEAMNASSEAWSLKRKALGAEHPLTAESLLTTGLIKIADKDYAGAEKSFDDALGVFNHTLNRQNMSFARAYMGRSFAHLQQGRKTASEKDFKEAIDLYSGAHNTGKHVHAKYRDLFIKRMGAASSFIDIVRERAKAPHSTGSSKFDTFGHILMYALGDTEKEDMFDFVSYKDVFVVLGIVFVVLIMLAMAIMIPGAMAFIFPWGRQDTNIDIEYQNQKDAQKGEASISGTHRAPPTRPTADMERRQVQVWKDRLSTMERDIPNAGQSSQSNQGDSGEFGRMNFDPNAKGSNSQMSANQHKPNNDEFKW